MQIRQIKIDRWYQTNDRGAGKCLAIGKRQVKLQIDGKALWLSPKDLRYEFARGQEPQVDEDADESEEVDKNRILEAWEEHQAVKAVATALLAGLRLAVHHLENPDILIDPESLQNLYAAMDKAETR